MTERDAVELAKEHIAELDRWRSEREPSASAIAMTERDRLTIFARAYLKERERAELALTSMGVLHAENIEQARLLGIAGSEIAELKARLAEKYEGWKRCDTHDSWTLLPDAQCPSCEIAALRAKVARLVKAGDQLEGYANPTGGAVIAWAKAKESAE